MSAQTTPKDPSSEPIDVYYNSVIKQRDKEIARLKEENLILLRLTIKRAQEIDELNSQFEQNENAKHKSDSSSESHIEGLAHMNSEEHHDRLDLPIDFSKDKDPVNDDSAEKIKAAVQQPLDHPWDD